MAVVRLKNLTERSFEIGVSDLSPQLDLEDLGSRIVEVVDAILMAETTHPTLDGKFSLPRYRAIQAVYQSGLLHMTESERILGAVHEIVDGERAASSLGFPESDEERTSQDK